MEKALVMQNRHWKGEIYGGLFARELVPGLLEKARLKEIQVLLGIRRSGKSTIFKLIINHLMAETDPRSILYVNLDDPFFSEVCRDARELHRLVETAEKITGRTVSHLFLDEVQSVREWQKYVKSVYDSEAFAKIFVTGSNSALLRGDYATLLSGRYVTDHVHPLSFREILANHGIAGRIDLIDKRPFVLKLFETVLQSGSFPEVLKITEPELRREVLVSYYETIVLKDCIATSTIREARIFKNLTHYLLSTIGGPYSYNSLARAVGSNENTVREFLGVLEESFLLAEVRNFSYSLKQQSKARKKCYCMDNGLINAVSFAFSENRGMLLENLVYAELLKMGHREVYFFSEQKECDFIVKSGREFIAVQVCYELNERNRSRELGGLKVSMAKHGIGRGILVTAEQEEIVAENVQVVPFWRMHELF
jgi:predicted AAA+ superfamily ATPase